MAKLETSNVIISNGDMEDFYRKFTAKIYFLIEYFMLPLLMMSWEASPYII